MSKHNHKIGFIGGGNMARSLIGGLVSAGYPAEALSVADPNGSIRTALAADFGINATADNQHIMDQCDVVVLAVKPQVMQTVTSTLHMGQKKEPLFLSVAAGIRTASLANWLGVETAIVRAMPNTPALVQSGATGLFANPHVSPMQRDLAESIMRAAGLVQWVEDEALMDAVTALSGSGPAYLFLVMEAMEKAAQKLGLPAETARLLTVQTAFGAAKLALEIEEDPALLRENVTSPGGTTERAIQVLRQEGLEDMFYKALRAARDRAHELADELGK
ncbi:MAG: pyrroline-5-carboxylate reductase [Gammaproteobacteria bacterium]|nr:pyrroline-5-carboxylate reductase [Gammaproteobacteria bacterium]